MDNELENMLHIRLEGRSWDIALADLDIGEHSTDEEIRNAAADNRRIPREKLRSFAVDRNAETNSITVRPEAVFG